MNGHDEYLELLAASIDFGLTEEEVARLNYHLASCPECRRAATELRGQAAAIATTPIAPLAPARSEQILRAAMRKPAARPRWGMLAVAALLATLAGGVALAGLRLRRQRPGAIRTTLIAGGRGERVAVGSARRRVGRSGCPAARRRPARDAQPRGSTSRRPADPAKLAFPLPYSANYGADPRGARPRRPAVGVGSDAIARRCSPCSMLEAARCRVGR